MSQLHFHKFLGKEGNETYINGTHTKQLINEQLLCITKHTLHLKCVMKMYGTYLILNCFHQGK